MKSVPKLDPDAAPLAGEGSAPDARVGAVLADGAARLAAAGIDNPPREARLLLNLALGIEANAMVSPDMPIAAADAERFAGVVARRAAHEPYSRIAGQREFWSLPFLLSPATLDPRPDSETLIEAALARIDDRASPLTVLDFGTGTGALLLALLSELPNATGLGIDRAPEAVATARRNATALGLAGRAGFACGNWGQALGGMWDVILANLPYIPSEQRAGLAPEVSGYDPPLALDGGPDGLRAYRELAPDVARLLGFSGFAVCEIGQGQGPAVKAIMAASDLVQIEARADLAGINRCLVFEPDKNVGKSGNKGLTKQKIVGLSGNSD
jgi:release factor glutamine methyltransferase